MDFYLMAVDMIMGIMVMVISTTIMRVALIMGLKIRNRISP
jgi:hypothetical protein